jgi:predicted nuclease of predicted toxin-antitoxin system
MRFFIDAQLPAVLARWLAANGHEAQHVSDVGMSAASDGVIWAYAVQHELIIVTKDEDFAQRRMLSSSGPRVLWLRFRNSRKQELLLRFSALLPQVVAAFERGEVLVEVV